MNAAEAIVNGLTTIGVQYVFGVPGGAIEAFNAAVYASDELSSIVTKHEQGAAFMADGYARVSGELGVCCATSGPGASNLLTGLASSYADNTPVLALTGQVATSAFGKGALQESGTEGISIVSMFQTVTKYSGMLINKKRTRYMLQKAVRTALTAPTGPTHLNLPMNMMSQDVNGNGVYSLVVEDRMFDSARLHEAAEKLLTAKHPVIVAGYGVTLSRSAYELLEFAKSLQIPVVTSPKGKGCFPEDNELSLGVLGFAGTPEAKQYVIDEAVDVMLAVGASFNEMMTNGWDEKIKPEFLIHVDVNPSHIGKNYHTQLGLTGDARMTLRELMKSVIDVRSHGSMRSNSLTMQSVARVRKQVAHAEKEEPRLTSGLYHPKDLVQDLQRNCPEDTIFFADMGCVMAWTTRYMKMSIPYCFYMGMGFASMGYAVAAPVGAKLATMTDRRDCAAQPDRPVIAMVGDGSFQMNGFEVATAVNYDIPVVWVVFNNAMLGMVYHGRKLFPKVVPDGLTPHFKQINFADLAETLGARGIRIENPGEITKEFMDDVLATKRPTVIDVLIDPDVVPPILSRIKAVDKMS